MMSLLHPEKILAKIPDVNCYDSATFQVVMDGVMGTASDGSCALAVYPMPFTPTGTGTAMVTSGTATAGSGQGNWTTQAQQAPPGSATVLQAFSMVRPVSGVLEIEYIGSTNVDQGQICLTPVFRSEFAALNFGTAVQNQMSVAGPLRNGIRALWKPMDVIDLQYEPSQAGTVSSLYCGNTFTTAPVASGSSSSSNGTDQPKAFLAAYITGATASTNVARYRWIVNYEGVPEKSGIDLFSSGPSENNTGYIDQAMNAIRQAPWADVWQPVAGVVGQIAQQALNSQMPALGGFLGAGLMGALQRSRSTVSRLPLTYDYPVD
jgi:hypothetical protein